MARILVISGSSDEGRGLARLLRGDGHRAHVAKTDSAACRLLFAQKPELLVLAVADPATSMRGLARALGSQIRGTPAIAVVPQSERETIDRDVPGLMDVLPTPFSDDSFLAHIDALLRVRGVIFGRTSPLQDVGFASQEAAGTPVRTGLLGRLRGFLTDVRPSRAKLRKRPLEPYLETAASIVDTVEGRDILDPGHAFRVSSHCASIAGFLGLGAEQTAMLLYAASVHDIGKIALPADLLSKPSLTESERKVVKFHPRRGAALIRALTPYEEAADVVLYHHERPDGQGYYGRLGKDVPRPAHILAVADVFDGMISSHSDRAALSPEQALEALRAGSGVLYDAECVEALTSSVRPRRKTIPVSAPTPPQH